jgi:hypothetical protein
MALTEWTGHFENDQFKGHKISCRMAPQVLFFCFPRLMRQDRAVGACSLQDKSIYQEAAAQILLNLLQDPGPPNTFHKSGAM